MAEQESGRSAMLSPTDFDALYQGRGVSYGDTGLRLDVVPWQLDEPQPLIVELEGAGEVVDPVLECGCGLGDNALFLAGRGHSVTAFDASATAIERDRAKADAAGTVVDFVVADATTLEGIPSGFRTVIDSAMLHCLTDDQRRDYLTALRRVCEPGARLHVLCFQAEMTKTLPLPGSLDEPSLRRAFADTGWRIRRMRTRRYTTGMTRQAWKEHIPAEMSEALLPELHSPAGVDEQGRALMPIWQITAEL